MPSYFGETSGSFDTGIVDGCSKTLERQIQNPNLAFQTSFNDFLLHLCFSTSCPCLSLRLHLSPLSNTYFCSSNTEVFVGCRLMLFDITLFLLMFFPI